MLLSKYLLSGQSKEIFNCHGKICIILLNLVSYFLEKITLGNFCSFKIRLLHWEVGIERGWGQDIEAVFKIAAVIYVTI